MQTTSQRHKLSKALYNKRFLSQLSARLSDQCVIQSSCRCVRHAPGMADKILRIMQFASKHGPPFRLIETVLQKNTKNVNMENLKHELLKHDLQVSDLLWMLQDPIQSLDINIMAIGSCESVLWAITSRYCVSRPSFGCFQTPIRP